MTRTPLALHQSVLPHEDMDIAGLAAPLPSPTEARAFLIGMRGPYDGPALQSMRLIVVVPGQRTHAAPVYGSRERIALQTLRHPHTHEALRPVVGDVLRDAQGRLYERRNDNTLRALGPVLAGTHGELYERAAADEIEDVEPLTIESTATTRPSTKAKSATRGQRRQRRVPAQDQLDEPARVTAENESPKGNKIRALLPAPGKWVEVPAGEFTALLEGQLAHPARIAADYRIGAWLQIFETDAALKPTDAASQIFGDEHAAARLAPWTTALAQRLGITVGEHRGDGMRSRARPGCIAAGQRFFALKIASDPTVADESALESDAEPRGSVPVAFQAARPPLVPREQAIARLQHARSPRWWERWRRRVSSSARAAWQHQLAHHSLEEQLWAVPPPPHGLGDERVREWATRTLRLAGYNAERMADEWEIFWRCRGAHD